MGGPSGDVGCCKVPINGSEAPVGSGFRRRRGVVELSRCRLAKMSDFVEIRSRTWRPAVQASLRYLPSQKVGNGGGVDIASTGFHWLCIEVRWVTPLASSGSSHSRNSGRFLLDVGIGGTYLGTEVVYQWDLFPSSYGVSTYL